MNIGKLRRGLNRVSRAAVQGRDNDFIRATRAIRKVRIKLTEMLKHQIEALTSKGAARIEQNLNLLAEAFSFNPTELKLATFLFIVKGYDEAETYLIDHLKCDRFRSRSSAARP